MKLQNFQAIKLELARNFLEFKRKYPHRLGRRLDLSWSIWMFGREPIERSLNRLKANGINYVELKGDNYTSDLHPDFEKINRLLDQFEMKVSGVCGLYSEYNDLSSVNPFVRQAAIDYIKKQIEYTQNVKGSYLIVVPSAVGRTVPQDEYELHRSAETLRACGPYFEISKVVAAVEPIRSAEVSLIHTVEQALAYIELVNHPAIYHINGDIYHMMCEEKDIAQAILSCGDRLVNLHIADSNRDGPGKGMIDLDSVIMAAYLIGMNQEGRFITFEPLGPYTNPYVLANSVPDESTMNKLVKESVEYFREREEMVRGMTESDLPAVGF